MSLIKMGVSASVATLMVSLCGVAHAQDEGSAGEEGFEADPVAEEEAVDEEGAGAEDAPDEEAADEKGEGSEGSEEGGEGRFRFGISGLGGPMVGSFKGGAGGLDMRFGWQLNNDYGIYAQPTLIVGVGADADASGVSASAAALAGTGVLFEWNPINLVYLGGGLGVLTGGVGSATATSTGGTAKAASGPFLEIPLRAGLALGSMEPNRRKAFTLGLDAHIVITGAGPVILPLVALGYDAF